MAFIIKDRVKETTTTTGTGDISLGGASSTFDQFQTYMSNGDTTYYAIATVESGVDEWEVGIGTWNTGNTLTRTTILAGSNSTSAVNFTAGDKQVFMTYPAAKAAFFNADGDLDLTRDPQTALQAATKQYVDTIAAAGLHYHAPVRVEHPSNLTATYNNGSSGVGATLTNAGTNAALVLDNVSMVLNDRVLVANQTDQTQNGVYTVTTVGDGSTAWVLTRSTDTDTAGPSDPDAFGKGDAFFIKEGDTNAGHLDVLTTTGTIVFGTTNIVFAEVAETTVYSAGNGLSLTGTEFSIGAGTGVTVGANSVSIGQAVSTSDTPTFAGLTSTANISLGDDDKVLLGASNDLEIYHESATGDSHIVNNGTGDLKVSSNITFGDNDKAIFGAGSDLQIYHDGSNSYISDQGTGNIKILANDFRVKNAADTESLIQANQDGEVYLYYNNGVKLATTSTGIDVTGTVTADGLTVDGYADIELNGANLQIQTHTSGTGIIYDSITGYHTFKHNGTNVGQFRPSGDFQLYEDTGTTAKFFWDASEERLKLTTSFAGGLVLDRGGNGNQIRFDNAGTVLGYIGYKDNTGFSIAGANGGADVTVDESGNVGIATTTPTQLLEINPGTAADPILQITNSNAAAYRPSLRLDNQHSGGRSYRTFSTATGDGVYGSGKFVIHDDDANTGRLVINAFGDVGIGATGPSHRLHVKGDDLGTSAGDQSDGFVVVYENTNTDQLTFTNERLSAGTTWETAKQRIQRRVDVTDMGYMQFGHPTSDLITFGEGSTEYVRIDGDGNLLVGTTGGTLPENGTTSGHVGVSLDASNYVAAARYQNIAGYFNRIGNDGDIVQFRKDGTTVGSIGTAAGDLSIGSDDAFLFFDGGANKMVPASSSTGGASNGLLDLGASDRRFKDLYLAGPAKLIPGTGGDAIVELGDPAQVQGGPHGFKFYKQGGSANDYFAFFFRTGDNTFNFESLNQASQLIKIAADTGKTIFNNSGRNDADFQVKSDTEDYMLFVDASTNYVSFGTNATDIGSSSTGEGVTYRNGESLRVQRDAGEPLIVNRVTDDGAVITLRKNGASSGSIGVRSGNVYLGTGNTNIRFWDSSDAVIPCDASGVGQDAALELGTSGYRFTNAHFSGTVYAASKSFEIDHPTKEGMRLRHGSLEGPEDAVYVRGKLTGDHTIQLPDYWTGLVHEDSITVQLTALGGKSDLWVENIGDNIVTVGCDTDINCFYFIQATRKDVDAWDVEYEA